MKHLLKLLDLSSEEILEILNITDFVMENAKKKATTLGTIPKW